MSINSNSKTSKYADVSMIKIDGTLIKKDGTTQPSNFFDFLKLNPSDNSNVAYTPEEAQRIRSHLRFLSTGSSAAAPRVCGGEAVCNIAKMGRCPFVEETKRRRKEDINAQSLIPFGLDCSVERNLLDEWTRMYVNEYEVNIDLSTEAQAFSDWQIVRELAEIELYLWRIKNGLAQPENTELIGDVPAFADKVGNVHYKKETLALFEVKERLETRKSRLIKLMVGDRQEKYKKEAALKIKDEGDPSIKSAQLRQQITKLLKVAEEKALKLHEVEGNVIDVEPEDYNGKEIKGIPPKTPIKEDKVETTTPQDLIDQVISGNDDE